MLFRHDGFEGPECERHEHHVEEDEKRQPGTGHGQIDFGLQQRRRTPYACDDDRNGDRIQQHRQKDVATSPLAVGANTAATTVFGGSNRGLDRDAESRRDRARIEAYNRHLASKGCPTVDIAAELARSQE